MAFPYPHRHRAQGRDQIEIHKAGTDSGTPVDATTVSTTTSYTKTINLPYNAWTLGGMFWAAATSAALTLKIRPWIDHDQTLRGNAMALSPYGDSTSATALAIAATTPTDGHAFQVLTATGALAFAGGSNAVLTHGVQVEVTVATAPTTGTFDFEILAVPRA